MNDNKEYDEFTESIRNCFEYTLDHSREIKNLVKIIGNKYVPTTLDDADKSIFKAKLNRANFLLIEATEALIDAYKITVEKEKEEHE